MVMKAKILFLALGLLAVVSARSQQRLQPIPVESKWLSNKEVAFTYDGSYTDPECFKLTLGKKTHSYGRFPGTGKVYELPASA